MDISNNAAPDLVYGRQRINSVDQPQGKRVRNTSGRQIADELALTDHAQLFANVKQAVQDSPEVREEKVAALREAVRKQAYEISYSEIARAILASEGR